MKEFFKKIHTDEFTWRDSGFYVFVVTILLVFLSGISSYPIQLFALSSESSLAASGLMYFSFITWWIVICLFCLIVKRYRYILKTFLKGMSGNTLKMFLCGLGIGFGTNTICVLCALFHKDIYLYFDSYAY